MFYCALIYKLYIYIYSKNYMFRKTIISFNLDYLLENIKILRYI
jgi:hypothetical protein